MRTHFFAFFFVSQLLSQAEKMGGGRLLESPNRHTELYCAPSWCLSLVNAFGCLIDHLISTELHCLSSYALTGTRISIVFTWVALDSLCVPLASLVTTMHLAGKRIGSGLHFETTRGIWTPFWKPANRRSITKGYGNRFYNSKPMKKAVTSNTVIAG